MSESSDSNSISSSEESESTQSQGNRSQSSAQESQTGSDNEESKNSSPENRIETEERPRQREPTNWGESKLKNSPILAGKCFWEAFILTDLKIAQ